MPLGIGWWYDRRSRRYHRIIEHASDATAQSRRFRAQAVAHLNPVTDREIIVRTVAAEGFIRARLWRGQLGWEFHGDPASALAVLRRFIKRHGLGPAAVVNISDFASGRSVEVSIATVLAARDPGDLDLLPPTATGSA